MELFSRSQVCGDFASCDYAWRCPSKTRDAHCERHGTWHESLIACVYPPRGFFWSLLRKKCSTESESQVNLSRVKSRGWREQGKCRMNTVLFSRRAFSGKGGHFGFGTCTDLSTPHARKTWHRSYMTRTRLMRMRFSTRNEGTWFTTLLSNEEIMKSWIVLCRVKAFGFLLFAGRKANPSLRRVRPQVGLKSQEMRVRPPSRSSSKPVLPQAAYKVFFSDISILALLVRYFFFSY